MVGLEKVTKTVVCLFEGFGVRFVPDLSKMISSRDQKSVSLLNSFSKKPNSQGKRTNIYLIWLFFAMPLDKLDVTYPPLNLLKQQAPRRMDKKVAKKYDGSYLVSMSCRYSFQPSFLLYLYLFYL